MKLRGSQATLPWLISLSSLNARNCGTIKPIIGIVCMALSSESWSLNSTYIHGTDVPVEEPSRASRPEVVASFDHLVGAGEQRGRHGEAKRIGGLKIDHQIEFYRSLDRKLGGVGSL